MLTLQEWGEIAKIAAPIVGPIIAAGIAVWQFKKQKVKEGRIRALEIDRAWSALFLYPHSYEQSIRVSRFNQQP